MLQHEKDIELSLKMNTDEIK